MKNIQKQNAERNYRERGFALLEYTVGAAVVLTVLYVAFNAFAGQLETLFTSLGEWAAARSSEIPQ